MWTGGKKRKETFEFQRKTDACGRGVVEREMRTKMSYLCLFFSEASQRAGILNPSIWLANRALVTGPAFCDTDHGSRNGPRSIVDIVVLSRFLSMN